jgi:hypothetical protein
MRLPNFERARRASKAALASVDGPAQGLGLEHRERSIEGTEKKAGETPVVQNSPEKKPAGRQRYKKKNAPTRSRRSAL